MLLLGIRTDKPEAEIYLYHDTERLDADIWLAHRQLAETLLTRIERLLKRQDKAWPDIDGIVCFEGPGSFTGLRIGLTVANTLSYSLGTPVTATSGETWLEEGVSALLHGRDDHTVLPVYGANVHITMPKK